jgi:type IV pilus assembly protein PilY1
MGLSYSEPVIVDTSAGWMVLAGNGYNSPNQRPFLYAIEPQHGTTLAKIDLCAAVAAGVCNPGLANGLSSVTAVNSYGQVSAPANTVYAGDLQGNVWRIDITNSNPANWIVSVIFQARDSLGNLQPITTVPAVTLNPRFPQTLGTMVFVGTGQMLGVGDLSTTSLQSMYGIFDPPTVSGSIPTRSNLVQQFLCGDTTAANVPVRDISGAVLLNAIPVQGNCNPPITAAAQVQLPQQRGWFVDLALYNGAVQTDPGERIITDPEIESGGGLVFTTYQPNPSLCQGGGSGWLMVLNYATGGSFPLPELDTNSDGNLDTKDLGTSTGNPVPVAMSLGPVYASSPTLLPAGSGIGGTMKMISVSSNNVDSILDRGRAKQRISWWELRH